MEELISAYVDGELAQVDAEEVSRHLSGCARCQASYALTLEISEACRQISQTVTPAPAEFKAALMQRINNETKVKPFKLAPWLLRNWKQAVGGIAAGILLVLGIYSMNVNSIMQVAQNPAPIVQPNQETTTGIQANQNDNPAGPTESAPETNNPSPGEDKIDPAPTDPVQPLNSSGLSSRIMMSKERSIVSALLQIKVNNSADALDKALNMAAQAQAETQNLGQPISQDGVYTALKITVAKSRAAGLLTQLGSLGTVINQEVTKNDITTRYAETLSQYQILFIQRTAATEANQQADLDQSLSLLQKQLENWEQQAEQETILLWIAK